MKESTELNEEEVKVEMTDEDYKEIASVLDDEDEKKLLKYSSYHLDFLMNSKWFRRDELSKKLKSLGATISVTDILPQLIKEGYIKSKTLDDKEKTLKYKVIISPTEKMDYYKSKSLEINADIEHIQSEIEKGMGHLQALNLEKAKYDSKVEEIENEMEKQD